MKLYTVSLVKETKLGVSIFVYVGWASEQDIALMHFSHIFGMHFALEATIEEGVQAKSPAIKAIWSPTTAENIIKVGKDKSRYWAGSVHHGTLDTVI